MKWDDEEDYDDIDEDDKHAFESLRKASIILYLCYTIVLNLNSKSQGDLRVHLDSILVIDQDMVVGAVQNLVLNTLRAYESGTSLKWNDVELALHLVFIFGEINKCNFLRYRI